jgi:hypothetical protein
MATLGATCRHRRRQLPLARPGLGRLLLALLLALGLTPGLPGLEPGARWPAPATGSGPTATGPNDLTRQAPGQTGLDGSAWPGAWLTTDLQASIGAPAPGRGVSRLSAARKPSLSLLPRLQAAPSSASSGGPAWSRFPFSLPLQQPSGALSRLRGPPFQALAA